ncbi:hypothetical protein [Sorangium sp. So ce341]|uniref:hypothetical protein n=1 Tax=Sorangium sp. So ce341 TaxID=3133302 RepID=UPI003F63C529
MIDPSDDHEIDIFSRDPAQLPRSLRLALGERDGLVVLGHHAAPVPHEAGVM